MTKKQALALIDTKWWMGKSAREICTFQMFEDRLCMPFSDFHKAVEESLGRPVWTHEFANQKELQWEFLGDRPSPTMQEIIELIPEAKLIIVEVSDGPKES